MKPVWIALGLCPLTNTIFLCGMSTAKEDAQLSYQRLNDEVADPADIVYRRVFNLSDKQIGRLLYKWLTSCGVSRDTATGMIRDLGERIAEIPTTEESDDSGTYPAIA